MHHVLKFTLHLYTVCSMVHQVFAAVLRAPEALPAVMAEQHIAALPSKTLKSGYGLQGVSVQACMHAWQLLCRCKVVHP